MSEELLFARLREDNEHEGEVYHYWLQVNGNEEALTELAETLRDEFFAGFSLRMDDLLTEEQVDLLVDETESGYMDFDQKFTGRLEWPTDQMSQDDWMDSIYKGSIKDCFKED
jgi:hypothetical protein